MIEQKRYQLVQKTIHNPAITGKHKKPELVKDAPAQGQGVRTDYLSGFSSNLNNIPFLFQIIK